MTYLGIDVDKRNKLIIGYGKSGAAVHFTDHFRVIPGKRLQQVYRRVESVIDFGKVKAEERRLRKGKWHTHVRILSEKEHGRLYSDK